MPELFLSTLTKTFEPFPNKVYMMYFTPIKNLDSMVYYKTCPRLVPNRQKNSTLYTSSRPPQ